MPEYGLCDKLPEQIEEERLKQEMIASFRRAEAKEAEAHQRKVDAENSNIQTAEILHKMMEQMQEIRDTQEDEHQARIEAEQREEKASRMQIKENRCWQAVLVIIGLLTLAATIFGVLK